MRLFVGVEVSAEVQRNTSRAIDELKRRVSRMAPRARLNWVTPERMHLTVQFIGSADTELASRILTAL